MPVPATLQLPEAEARRVVLVQAIESVDERGKLLGKPERDAAEQAVIDRMRNAHGDAPPAAAYLPERASALLQAVEARNPSLARLETRDPWWDRLGILLPLVALLAGFSSDRIFNSQRTDLLSPSLIGVALWNVAVYVLLALSLIQRKGAIGRTLFDLPSWFRTRAAARLRESASAEFRMLWWQAAGALESARVQQVLHLAAAAWALGVVLSILLTGVNTRFRVGWESTWFGAPQVHAVLSVMAAPAQAIGFDAFTLDEVRRLEFGKASDAGQPEARKWALVYIVFITALVGLPRLALWAWARVRARSLARRIPIDASDPYFAQAMARVLPARIVVGLRTADPTVRRCVGTVFAQAADIDDPRGDAALVTGRGDRLLFDPDATRPDIVWDLPPETAACWALEQPVHDWLRANVPEAQRAGLARLIDAWSRNHQRRWHAATGVLGRAWADSARDSEEVQGNWPGAKEREAANAALLTRLQDRLEAAHRDLLRLHAAETGALAHGIGQGRAEWMQQGGASAAGALAGALAGAKIDLITGGLTLGAGMALGALLGGAGAFTAARTWLMGSTVRLGREQLQTLAQSLVLQYLAVIHAGRALDKGDGIIPGDWQGHAQAAIEARAADIQRIGKLALTQDAQAAQQMTQLLQGAAWDTLAALYGRDRLVPLTSPN